MRSFIIVLVCILILVCIITITMATYDPDPDPEHPILFKCYTETPRTVTMNDMMRQVITAREIDKTFRTVDYRFTNAVYTRYNLWKRNFTITIGFKDGTEQQKQTVKDIIMSSFQPLVDMKFDFVSTPSAHILISFVGLNGQPMGNGGVTYSLGFRNPSTTPSLCIGSTGKFLVQHEFLHHLGCYHEMNSSCDNPLVIDVAKQANPSQFQKVAKDKSYCTPWDSKSIMNYPFTDNNGIVVRPASSMTELDRAFVQVLYKSDYVVPAELIKSAWQTPPTVAPPKTSPTTAATTTTTQPPPTNTSTTAQPKN